MKSGCIIQLPRNTNLEMKTWVNDLKAILQYGLGLALLLSGEKKRSDIAGEDWVPAAGYTIFQNRKPTFSSRSILHRYRKSYSHQCRKGFE